MFLPLPAVLIVTPLFIGVADKAPRFNLNATCGGSDGCVKSENAAHEDLAKQWAQFPAADRARCVRLTTVSKMPSYVQVITCLEMARDARRLNEPAAR
jgi:hypothetical protein